MFQRSFLFVLLFALALFKGANAMEIDENHPVIISIPASPNKLYWTKGRTVATPTKQVALMGVKLTSAEKQILAIDHSSQQESSVSQSMTLPVRAYVGMNNVPVLDQGIHGSCVTFATTAAIDALLKKGDYVSQLCQLELGSYLAERSYMSSGWEGTSADLALHQMETFGIVNKNKQKTGVCAGVTEYTATEGQPMSLDDFKKASEDIYQVISEPMLTVMQRFYFRTPTPDEVLAQIKQTLATPISKDVAMRVVMGVFIASNECPMGACGKHNQGSDTWVITPAMRSHLDSILGGHEMVVIGYDDEATAVDAQGNVYKGLLTLRNSWGSNAGDHGEFYMAYDYFKQYVIDADKILAVQE